MQHAWGLEDASKKSSNVHSDSEELPSGIRRRVEDANQNTFHKSIRQSTCIDIIDFFSDLADRGESNVIMFIGGRISEQVEGFHREATTVRCC